ncbi:MAG: RusA family crossover junction endodeoxyribonuclease [Peptostreptococcaceae bacterium]
MGVDADRIRMAIENYEVAYIGPSGDDEFNRELVITIPGPPISDSRPRLSSDKTYFYNPHKEDLKKLFRPLYRSDELLREICVLTPTRIVMEIYHKADKESVKTFGAEFISTDKVRSTGIQDLDNFEKVHWDVLQDKEFRVILDDRNVCENMTKKFYSFNPRVVIRIQYNDDFDSMFNQEYLNIIKNKKAYKLYTLSPKYLNKYMKDSNNEEKADFIIENMKALKISKASGALDILNQYDRELLVEIVKKVSPNKIIKPTKGAITVFLSTVLSRGK